MRKEEGETEKGGKKGREEGKRKNENIHHPLVLVVLCGSCAATGKQEERGEKETKPHKGEKGREKKKERVASSTTHLLFPLKHHTSHRSA